MGPRAARAVAAVATALLLAAPAALAAPPIRGTLVPDRSLGGVRLGMSKAELKAIWGTSFGRCRDCLRETWYFNYRPFTPQGAGVTFKRGRVVQVFTVWQPLGWRTTKGLALGALEGEVTRFYGSLPRRSCGDYEALVLRGERAQSAFYVHDGTLWGFGLTRPESSPCV